jgi:hypothetical protein
MAISIEWIVTRLEVMHKDGLENVAVQACFDVEGSDGDLKGFTQSDVSFASTDPATFTPIEQVTKEQAAAWVKKALGSRVTEFEDRVVEQIERQRAPQPKSIDLPWMAASEPEQAPLG